jgi:hypothetical protein
MRIPLFIRVICLEQIENYRSSERAGPLARTIREKRQAEAHLTQM